MKQLLLRSAAAALAFAPLSPVTAAPDAVADLVDTRWRNPGNSVHVRLDRCGAQLCSTIIWASPKAVADAKRGGTESLIGTQLFRNFQSRGGGKWSGKVFVPDIRKTFSGTLTFQGSETMVGKGCVLFGVICKSQTWSRLR